MLIDLKYHIVSLIAVFLALGAGILIGSTLIPNTILIERQNAVISKIEKDFAKMKEENQKIKDSLELNTRLHREILPVLIREKINGKRVVIIETNNSPSSSLNKELSEILREGGAEIKSFITIKDGFGMESEILKNRITEHLGIKNKEKKNICLNLGRRLAREISGAKDMPLLEYLKEQKVLRRSGKIDINPDAVIFIGGSYKEETNVEIVDIPMIKTFKEYGITVVGTEPKNVKISSVGYYQREEISTIDNIDTIPGQVSLVYVLSGVDGDFGIKRTAREFIPKISK